jgi:DNA polymerase (family X)
LNEKLDGITVLKDIEVDILADGKLDLPDTILSRLDIVVASVHSHFDFTAAAQTERIIRAMDIHHLTILGHPTGRLIGEREPYALDLDRVIAAARERDCFLEINSQPERLDLDDIHTKMAKDKGVKLAISTDAHSPDSLSCMRFGIDQARRGWLTRGDVINTRPLAELRKLLKR